MYRNGTSHVPKSYYKKTHVPKLISYVPKSSCTESVHPFVPKLSCTESDLTRSTDRHKFDNLRQRSLKFWNFKNPRVAAAIMKNRKIAVSQKRFHWSPWNFARWRLRSRPNHNGITPRPSAAENQCHALSCVVVCVMVYVYSRFDKTPVCDGQICRRTDRRT